MANTFIKIASVTVGSGGAASMAFTSIPSTFTDLSLLVSARFANAIYYFKIAINGTTSAYAYKTLNGSGSSANSEFYSTPFYIGMGNNSGYTANTFSSNSIYIPNYASSNNKSISSDSVVENNATEAIYSQLAAALMTNSAAISSITLTPDSGNFVQYSTATLYGIKKD
jgi:hypothetical protein